MVILKSTKDEIHRFFLFLANTKLASHILRGLRDYYFTTIIKIFSVKCVKPRISLNIQWLQITVFLRRMEGSDFMSILAR